MSWVLTTERWVVKNYHAQDCKNLDHCPLISTYDGLDANATYPYKSQSYWYRITIPAHFDIPEDCKAVELIGELIITCTNPAAQPDMAVFFRAPAAPPSPLPTSAYDFVAQAVVTGLGGIRTPCYVTVPVIGQQFDFAWYRNDAYVPTPGVTYGFKFYINAWSR